MKLQSFVLTNVEVPKTIFLFPGDEQIPAEVLNEIYCKHRHSDMDTLQKAQLMNAFHTTQITFSRLHLLSTPKVGMF